MKETELAQKFVDYLSDTYDLYFEVGRMDIVGKSGSIVIAVEVKKALNFKVIQQAYDNIRSCHYSYIAVPRSSADNNPFGLKICEHLGIGVLLYNDKSGYYRDNRIIYERVKPRINRKAFVQYTKNLSPDSIYKRTTPGAKSGDTVTAFSCMVDDIERHVRRHQGCTIKELFESVKHHYSSMTSARSCLVQYIDSGVIKNIRRDGNKLYLKQQTDHFRDVTEMVLIN